MVLFGIPFTTMSIVMVPLLLGLGVDYSVHLSHNYRLELSNGKTPGEAIKNSILEIGTAMFLAMITTVIAFLSFLSATIPPLRDLGLLLGLGIFYTFITAITLQASIRYLVDRNKKDFNIIKRESFRLNYLMGKLAQLVLSHQKTIIFLLVVITLIAGFGATQIQTGFDLNSFLPEENQAIKILGELEENFPSVSQYQEYILLEGDVDNIQALNGIRKTHENLKDDNFVTKNPDGSPNVDSIYTLIYQAVRNNNSLIEEFDLDENTYIPKNNRDIELLYDYLSESLEYGLQTQLVISKNDEGNYNCAVIRVNVNIQTTNRQGPDLDKDLVVLSEELEEDLEDYGNVKTTVTGYWSITHEITTSLTDSQILSTGISLILASIVLIIAYRRFSLGVIAMIPVIVSIVWILGTMYFIGYNLDVLTISVTSLTIGIGVDYAIHATERFRLVADKTGDVVIALTETISKTGGALLIAALTTTLGFGMLTLAPMPPQVQFGIIMVLTIAFSFITSVLLLPLILARWGKWSKKKKGFIISSRPADIEYLNNSTSNNNEKIK
jgi:predicted RND superfamily exporter protein